MICIYMFISFFFEENQLKIQLEYHFFVLVCVCCYRCRCRRHLKSKEVRKKEKKSIFKCCSCTFFSKIFFFSLSISTVQTIYLYSEWASLDIVCTSNGSAVTANDNKNNRKRGRKKKKKTISIAELGVVYKLQSLYSCVLCRSSDKLTED